MAPLLIGKAALGGVAATTGLFGTAGAFTIGQTLLTTGIAASVFGQFQAGRAAEVQAEADAALFEQNAKLKEREAAEKLRRGRVQAELMGEEGEEFAGRALAIIGKSGVQLKGSPALVLDDRAEKFEADRMQILENAFKGRGFSLQEAEIQRFKGRSAIARGKNKKRAATLSAAGTLLTGFGGT